MDAIKILKLAAQLGFAKALKLLTLGDANAREVGRLRDAWNAFREADWEVRVENGCHRKYCKRCNAWEQAGCRPGCLYRKFPRVGYA